MEIQIPLCRHFALKFRSNEMIDADIKIRSIFGGIVDVKKHTPNKCQEFRARFWKKKFTKFGKVKTKNYENQR